MPSTSASWPILGLLTQLPRRGFLGSSVVLGGTGFLRLPRRGDGSKLLKHTQHVTEDGVFRYLATGEAAQAECRKRYLVARWGKPQKLPLWLPRQIERAETLYPSATCSSSSVLEVREASVGRIHKIDARESRPPRTEPARSRTRPPRRRRYTIAAATSSGQPLRPTGISFTISATNSSKSTPSRAAVSRAYPSRRGCLRAGSGSAPACRSRRSARLSSGPSSSGRRSAAGSRPA
jgi:hypothetical protein